MESMYENYRADEDENKNLGRLLQNSKMTYHKSQRGYPILMIQNWTYRRERLLPNGKTYWRCMKPKCRGRLTVSDGTILKFSVHSNEACQGMCW